MRILKGLFLILCFSAWSSAEAKVTLQLWHQMMYAQRQLLAKVVEDFEKDHPEIHVHLTYRETEELRSSFQASALGGSGPDLIYGPSDQVGPFATMGLILPWDEILPPDFLTDLDPLAVPPFEGKHYLLGDSVGNHLMLIYNKKLVAEPPRTTDELIETAERFSKDGNYGLVFNYTEPFFFVPWIAGFGSETFFDNQGPHLNSPATMGAFSFIQSLKDHYKIIPNECDYEMANSLFKEGRAPFIINGDWSWGDYKAAGVDFGVAPLPQVSATGRWPAPLVGTKGYSLNKNSPPENRAAILTLLKYLLSAPVQERFSNDLGVLPSRLSVRELPEVQSNPLLKSSREILSKGQALPLNPEARALWDSLRPAYQSVLAGRISPAAAAEQAQTETLRQIAVMNEVLTPGMESFLFKGLALLLAVILAVGLVRNLPLFWELLRGPQKLGYWMILPGFLAIFAVIIFPFLFNIVLSFSNLSLRTFNSWEVIGLAHYWEVFKDPQFYAIFAKTVAWTLLNVFMHVSIGVILALLIDQVLPFKGFWRVLLIIPWAVPQYITALTWRGLFHQEYGPINIFLQKYLHLSPLQWLSDPILTFSACLITNVWLGFPFMMVVALGGLGSIPHELYEAARLDGANAFQRFRHITWPLLIPVMKPAALLGCIWTFNNLNVVWLVSNGGEPADQTHILVSYVYKAAFNLYRYGYAAALSMIIFILLLVFGWNQIRHSKELES